MADFKLVSNFQPSGDQPEAINELVDGIKNELNHQKYQSARMVRDCVCQKFHQMNMQCLLQPSPVIDYRSNSYHRPLRRKFYTRYA